MTKQFYNSEIINLRPYQLSDRFSDNFNNQKLLDWNEGLFGISDALKSLIITDLANIDFGIYPNGDNPKLQRLLSDYTTISEKNILTFNGSDSALRDCFASVLSSGKKVITIEPEYNQIDTYIQINGAKKIEFKPANTFDLDLNDLLKFLELQKGDVLYLSNPSNPTGRLIDEKAIKKILDTGIMVFLDEAYVEYSQVSLAKLTYDYENLIVFRTFSKAMSLAALRLGYVITSQVNIEMLNRLRNLKELNILAQIAAIRVLENIDQIHSIVEKTNQVKDYFVSKVQGLDKFEVRNSYANFVLIKHSEINEVIFRLKENGILVRDRSSMFQMRNTARVTIGPRDVMDKVFGILSEFT